MKQVLVANHQLLPDCSKATKNCQNDFWRPQRSNPHEKCRYIQHLFTPFFCKNLRSLTSTLFIHLRLPLQEYIFLPKNTSLEIKKKQKKLSWLPTIWIFEKNKRQTPCNYEAQPSHPISSVSTPKPPPSARGNWLRSWNPPSRIVWWSPQRGPVGAALGPGPSKGCQIIPKGCQWTPFLRV